MLNTFKIIILFFLFFINVKGNDNKELLNYIFYHPEMILDSNFLFSRATKNFARIALSGTNNNINRLYKCLTLIDCRSLSFEAEKIYIKYDSAKKVNIEKHSFVITFLTKELPVDIMIFTFSRETENWLIEKITIY